MSQIGIWFDPIDSWAAGETLIKWTCGIDTVCLIVSLILWTVRLYQLYVHYKKLHIKEENGDRNIYDIIFKDYKLLSVNISHIMMMTLSCCYLTMHWLNYIYFFIPTSYGGWTNGDCTHWFKLTLTFFVFTRLFLYSFLMIRTTVSFRTPSWGISYKFTLGFVIFIFIIYVVALSLTFSDFTPINPVNGACFRILGINGEIGNNIFITNVDPICSSFQLMVFLYATKQIKKELNNAESEEIYHVFRKHILLGSIAMAGSFTLGIFAKLLSVTLGLGYGLDFVVNNCCVFLMFKANQSIFDIICCNKWRQRAKENADNLAIVVISSSTNTDDITQNSKSTANTQKQHEYHE